MTRNEITSTRSWYTLFRVNNTEKTTTKSVVPIIHNIPTWNNGLLCNGGPIGMSGIGRCPCVNYNYWNNLRRGVGEGEQRPKTWVTLGRILFVQCVTTTTPVGWNCCVVTSVPQV